MLEKESKKLQDAFKEMTNKMKYSDYCMPFGKYKGCFLADIYSEDPEYFEWLSTIADKNKATDYPNLSGAIAYLKGEL